MLSQYAYCHMGFLTVGNMNKFITARIPLLDYATLSAIHTQGHNIKFILPHCSKNVYKHSFLPVALRSCNALLQSMVQVETLNPVQSQPSRCCALMSQRASCFYLAPCGFKFFAKCTFFFNFLFLGIMCQSSVLTARVYWKIENVSG